MGVQIIYLNIFYASDTIICPDLFFPEKAKAFWNNEDVDQVFDVVFKYLEHLKAVLKRSGTTDKGSDPCLMRASGTLAIFLS